MELGPIRREHRVDISELPRPKVRKARREEEARYVRVAAENQARLRREFLERQERAA